jgi:cytoskeletal protein CcmA (bactofilin family)
MFNKDKATASEKNHSNSATLVSPGTILQGDIRSDNDLRIDGTIQGNVSSTAKIVVGPSGVVEGNIEGVQADITGKVIGNIAVKELLQLRGECNVDGNVSAAKLQVDPTAVFNGQCKMTTPEAKAKVLQKAGVVQMNELDVAAKAK